MKRTSQHILFLLGFMLLSLKGTGQNLVPNGDFSQIAACDTVQTKRALLKNWFLAPGELRNGLYTNMHSCVPVFPSANKNLFDTNKIFGFHLLKPYTGKGYTGLNSIEDSLLILSGDTTRWQRNILQCRLKQPLDTSKQYFVSFVAYRPSNITEMAKEIGLALTRDTLHHNDLFSVNPQLKTPSGFKDTLWTPISKVYTAKGGEEYLSIGAFLPYDSVNIKKFQRQTSSFTWYFLLIDAVSVYPLSQTRFTIDLPEDTTVCGGDTLLLDPVIRGGIPDDTSTTYRWSNGTTDSVLRVTQPGTYWVEVTMNGQFSESDTFRVSGIPALPRVQKPDTLLCPGDSVIFTLPQDTFFTATWRDGFPSLTRYLLADTVYPYQLASACDTQQRSLRIIALVCDTVPVDTGGVNPEDSIEFSDYAIVIPDAFTPNGDGLNETWDIPGLPPGSGVRIYNRWGEQLYQARPYRQPWDGTNREGKRLPTGVYLYRIAIPNPGGGDRIKQGTVKVLR